MSLVRLKIAYKTPESLLGEMTKSVGRGGVRLEAREAVPVGTEFVFELWSPGVSVPVEVSGKVLSVTETAPERFVLDIRYQPPSDRPGLDAMLQRIFDIAAFDTKRRAPRIPLHVRATENRPDGPNFRLRDISPQGVGVDVEADALPSHIQVGSGFVLQLKMTTGILKLAGEVVWAVPTRFSPAWPPRVGIGFVDVRPEMAKMLDDLLALRALPSPPWIARVSFEPPKSS